MTREEAVDVAIRATRMWSSVVYIAFDAVDAESVSEIVRPMMEEMGWSYSASRQSWRSGDHHFKVIAGCDMGRGCRAHFIFGPELAEKCWFSGTMESYGNLVTALKCAEVAR
jgi:hypothetical protein